MGEEVARCSAARDPQRAHTQRSRHVTQLCRRLCACLPCRLTATRSGESFPTLRPSCCAPLRVCLTQDWTTAFHPPFPRVSCSAKKVLRAACGHLSAACGADGAWLWLRPAAEVRARKFAAGARARGETAAPPTSHAPRLSAATRAPSSCVLTLFGWLPGTVHAWYIVFKGAA